MREDVVSEGELVVRLRDYLRLRDGDSTFEVHDLTTPTVNGMSNDARFFTLTSGSGAMQRAERLVLRRSDGERADHLISLAAQGAVMRRVAARGIPVPKVWHCEEDRQILGGPFLIMQRVDGDVPPTVPSMNAAGVYFEMSEHDRRQAYLQGVRAMARIHRARIGPPELPETLCVATTMKAMIGKYRSQYESLRETHVQSVEDAFDWLDSCAARESTPVLCWGDSRPGNLIYQGTAVAAVLDWEMASVAAPESDVAWWLSTERMQTRGMGVARLPGLPDRETTLACYQAASGIELQDLLFHEVFAHLRMAVISLEMQARRAAASGWAKRPGVSPVMGLLDAALTSAGQP